MKPEAKKRIDRLISWVKNHRKDLLTDGEPDARKFPGVLGASEPYWYGVLGKQASRSFGAAAARKTESTLGMEPFYLEGMPVADWPFELVNADEFYALTPKQQGAVEKAMRDAIDSLCQKQGAGA